MMARQHTVFEYVLAYICKPRRGLMMRSYQFRLIRQHARINPSVASRKEDTDSSDMDYHRGFFSVIGNEAESVSEVMR